MKRVDNLVTSSWKKLGNISNSTQYLTAHSAEKLDKHAEVRAFNLVCINKIQLQHVGGVIYQGDTIASQTWTRSVWLSCSSTPYCSDNTCPLMYLTSDDWNRCRGEVFRIYRALGPGAVRVGDLVGLYYPRGGRWLGCAGINCAKATCPGYPTTAYGFVSPEHWYRCWGEVFKIYARGKGSGAVINAQDDIALYYLQQGLWVGQGYERLTGKYPCLGSSRPPPLASYDGCGWENFRIWKRD